MDWFGVSEEKMKNFLFDEFQHIPCIEGCELIDSIDEIATTLAHKSNEVE